MNEDSDGDLYDAIVELLREAGLAWIVTAAEDATPQSPFVPERILLGQAGAPAIFVDEAWASALDWGPYAAARDHDRRTRVLETLRLLESAVRLPQYEDAIYANLNGEEVEPDAGQQMDRVMFIGLDTTTPDDAIRETVRPDAQQLAAAAELAQVVRELMNLVSAE